MDFRKAGVVPVEANAGEQAKFLAGELGPRLQEARDGKRALFFADAAHFVHAPFIGYPWSFEHLFLKAPAGRQLFDILGAPNAVTPGLAAVTNDTYTNVASVCELPGKIAALATAVPTTLVLDNSKYQRLRCHSRRCLSSVGVQRAGDEVVRPWLKHRDTLATPSCQTLRADPAARNHRAPDVD